MQIQHESQLIETSPMKSEDLILNYSQPLDRYTLHQTNFNSIEHLACSSSDQGATVLAVHSKGSNQISLIDTKNAPRRDRFSLKSCDKRFSRQSFVVKGVDFSPDGTRLAVGQSDCIIYIYKIGQQQQQQQQDTSSSSENPTNFGRPVISGKFVCSSPVTCLIWTEMGIIFGTRDGKLKLISQVSGSKQVLIIGANEQPSSQQQPTQTKVINLHNSPKGTMPLVLASKMPVIAVGFADGSIQIMNIISSDYDPVAGGEGTPASRRSSTHQASSSLSLNLDHGCPPNQLALIQKDQLCCAGSDGRLAFYTVDLEQGKSVAQQSISLKEEIISLDYCTINDILALITRNRLLFAILNAETNKWQLQTSSIEFLPLTTLTCLRWMRDGAQLAVGTRTGSLELFRCSWCKQSLNDQLDICHIAKNRVRITDRERNLLATYKTMYDIKRVNLFDEGQNVLIWTTGSLLMAHLGVAQSEIRWRSDKGASKFCFNAAGYVIIFTPSMWELCLVKLGQDCIQFTTKMDSQALSKGLISLSCFPRNRLDDSSEAAVAATNKSSNNTKRGSELLINNNDVDQQPMEAGSSSLRAEEDSVVVGVVVGGRGGKKKVVVPVEKLALVTNSGQHLNLIHLGTPTNQTRQILAKETETRTIVWLDLSCTGKYLAWKNSSNRMSLLQIDQSGANNSNEIKLDHVSYCRWIPESDILIAQCLHKIYIWYKIELLHHPRVIDSRSYNILKRAPIIDLSCHHGDGSARAYPEISHLTSSHISLSNGSSIKLDSLFIRFHRELIGLRLELAASLLEKETTSPEGTRVSLWTQLGWAAIKEEDLDIAMRAFKEINHASMVEYLRDCSAAELDEMHWRLAKLNGDWGLFEQLQDPERVVSTYKRLNKWSRCIEYLSRTQQYRQKDLAEKEFRKWLIGRGRHLEAAKMQAKQTGDLEGAIELLMERGNNHEEEAAKLLLDEFKTNTLNFGANLPRLPVQELIDRLVALGSYNLAAKLCAKILNKPDEALDLFLRGEHYDEALALVGSKEQADQIKRELGAKLLAEFRANKVTKRQAVRSIELYLESGTFIEAVQAAIELKEGRRALELLETHVDRETSLTEEQIETFCEDIAHILRAGDQKSLAIRAYKLGKQYARVVELSIEEKQFDEAFRVSLKFLHGENRQATKEEFKRLAEQKLRKENDPHSAEQLYLLIGEVDSVIEMHRACGNPERMLEIVEQYQPECMESNLLLLAKEMEQKGKFEEAERYLLRAGEGEWTNVVRMYRLANRWDGAYRVARQHCQSAKDPLLVQLAYFWAKSELASSGSLAKTRELLETKLDCLQEVLGFSCDNNNFAFAIELCADQESNREEKRGIVKKYANYLEKNGDLCKAEEILVQNNQLEGAIRMYLDNDMYVDAIRVVEEAQQSGNNNTGRHLADLMNGTLVEAANRVSSQIFERSASQMIGFGRSAAKPFYHEATNDDKQLALAQQMYLRAQRPELAIDMYKRCGLWQEAIQLAQRFAPQLLESVEQDLDTQVGLDLKPIINGANLVQTNSRMSRSSSRSSSLATTVTLNGVGADELAQLDATDQFLQSRAEQFIRRGQDPRSTRQALGKLIGNLADGDLQNEASCSILAERLAQFEQQLQSFEPESVRRIHSMTEQLFQIGCPLIGPMEHLAVWQKFRNLMGKLLKTSQELDDVLLEQSERKLLALHYVVLYKCLFDRAMMASGQPSTIVLGPLAAEQLSSRIKTTASGKQQQLAALVNLLSKLSMSLLRYSDLLDGRACFLSAGFWSLVVGQTSLARFAWSRLIESIDGTESRLERQLMQADCPMAQQSGCLVSSKYQSLGDIRGWLIESLLENRASLEFSSNLEEDGQLESSLRGGQFRPCLVSGYPVFLQSLDRLVLSGSQRITWEVRHNDWKTLKMLATESSQVSSRSSRMSSSTKKAKQLKLDDCVQFVDWLTGPDK